MPGCMPDKTESVQLYVRPEVKRALRIAAAKNEQSMAEFVRESLADSLEENGVRFDGED